MKKILFATFCMFPGPVGSQPYSESMADCASLFQNAAQWVKTDESADKLMLAATQWAEAAMAQANSEGLAVTAHAIWEKIDNKTEKWEAKGARVFFSQEFRDWTQYCRKFAKDRGIRIHR
ncbi:hypothetical protein OS190_04630 [Sulfitobacter sp. F26204]|uniref:hypothetical protein n=1 Tax=Sulfitobacter sp. F26204 TaxID=2996014 RepID=UPI00225E3BA7|nr:hypothetical protein [Sulfitobacter sp. F26204]MCX7558842.1 hypothetical protein [Sulfitobacter sp. F26204]